MKRMILDLQEEDSFEREWAKEFGPEQSRKFDSLDEFVEWMKEVDSFEASDDKTVRQGS